MPDVAPVHPVINDDEHILRNIPEWRNQGLSPRIIYARHAAFKDRMFTNFDFDEKAYEYESRFVIELLRSEVFLQHRWRDPTYKVWLKYNRGCDLPTDCCGFANFYQFVRVLNDKLEFKHESRQ